MEGPLPAVTWSGGILPPHIGFAFRRFRDASMRVAPMDAGAMFPNIARKNMFRELPSVQRRQRAQQCLFLIWVDCFEGLKLIKVDWVTIIPYRG